MKKLKQLFVTCSILASVLTTNTLQADELDLALSNDTAKVMFSRSGVISERSQVNATYFHHQDGIDMFDIDVLVGDANSTNQILIGGKAFYLSDDNLDGTGIALGVTGSASVAHKVFLKGHFFYAPSVTSFNDIKNYQDIEIRLAYQIIPEAEVAIGYRNAEVGIDNAPDVDIQKNVFAALTLSF